MVGTLDDLRRLEKRVVDRLRVLNYADYTETPRKSGYRAVHIIVPYQEMAIEIQLRTRSMHAWALAAEGYSELTGENLKQDGEHPIQLFMASASDIMALQEKGEPVPSELAQLHHSRRLAARPYLEESRT